MKTLIDDLKDFSLSQQLSALCDGEFLCHYNVTQEEVEEFYSQLIAQEKIEG
jgi:hypothetical protein